VMGKHVTPVNKPQFVRAFVVISGVSACRHGISPLPKATSSHFVFRSMSSLKAVHRCILGPAHHHLPHWMLAPLLCKTIFLPRAHVCTPTPQTAIPFYNYQPSFLSSTPPPPFTPPCSGQLLSSAATCSAAVLFSECVLAICLLMRWRL
jgi:hypothetical protein